MLLINWEGTFGLERERQRVSNINMAVVLQSVKKQHTHTGY